MNQAKLTMSARLHDVLVKLYMLSSICTTLLSHFTCLASQPTAQQEQFITDTLSVSAISCHGDT